MKSFFLKNYSFFYYSTLADNLLKKLPNPPKRHTFNSLMQYYKHFIQTDAFRLTYTTEIDIEKKLKKHKWTVQSIYQFRKFSRLL